MKRTLTYLAIAGVLGIAWAPPSAAQVVQTPLDPAGIPKFVNNLPVLKFAPDKNGNWKGDMPVVLGTAPITLSICEFRANDSARGHHRHRHRPPGARPRPGSGATRSVTSAIPSRSTPTSGRWWSPNAAPRPR